MRTVKWNAYLSGLCTLAVVLGVLAAGARADVVTEKGASILVFPKVLANGEFDTIIQITNTSNSMVHARCFYRDGQLPPGCEREAPLLGCMPICQTIDFTIWLTKQQPTHWLVSKGRPTDPTDDFLINVDGAGIDPGPVPPTPEGFTGELKCVEVTADGLPIGGNHLKGEATLKRIAGPNQGDVSKYNAIGIQGTENVGATGNVLQLNNPRGTTLGQYNACPQTLIVNHFADNALDPVIEGFARGYQGGCSGDADVRCDGADQPAADAYCTSLGLGTCTSPLPDFATPGTRTSLTLVPCSQDYQSNEAAAVTVQFKIYNEFEEQFSASTTVTCWKDMYLTDIDSPNNPENSVFSVSTLGSDAAQTRIVPADDLDGAVIGVVEATRTDRDANEANAAANIHTEGDRFFGTDGGAFDEIIMSDEF